MLILWQWLASRVRRQRYPATGERREGRERRQQADRRCELRLGEQQSSRRRRQRRVVTLIHSN